MNHHKQGVCSKNAPCLTRPARARQDVPFLKQGRRGFGARIVHGVREGERREERQACEREADKDPRTPLADFFNRSLPYFSLGPKKSTCGFRTKSTGLAALSNASYNPSALGKT
ncbi:MAG: hypothetical protein V3U07_09265 [Nitrospirales bacterium]